jgi:hypothetical protein
MIIVPFAKSKRIIQLGLTGSRLTLYPPHLYSIRDYSHLPAPETVANYYLSINTRVT